MAADFRDILDGRRPVHVIAEDDQHLAFLAERPARPGHVVVITRQVADSVFDLDEAAHAALWAFVHTQGQLLRERLPCARVCVSVIGWAVRHAHVHLLPTDAPGQVPGLDGEPLPAAEMAALAARLRGEP
ncbi:MAG: HIT family protein [Planctomycetes bacterium]|nr:HIT family protein [Planctomycetota bacterium]MCB9885152.1 HIT family protein [Planctomycetota bacterium]